MKKLVLCVVLILLLASLTPSVSDGRPAYCNVALENCAQRCAQFWLGIQFATDGCVSGCFLGYLFC